MIRRAVESDLPSVRDLLVETWHATYDVVYGVDRVSQITGEWHSLAALKQRLARKHGCFLVAECDGLLAAMAFAAPAGTDELRLHQLYVRPASQGAGLGTRLLEAVKSAYPAALTLSLEVEAANSRARSFYQRHGFVPAGATADCGARQSGIPALVYVRRLR